MREKDKGYLLDILDSAQKIQEFTREIDYKEFLQNAEKQSAVERKLEIIGEATKRLSPELKSSYPEIPWREMAGLRDKVIHDYPELELKEIWQIVKKDIAGLKREIQKIINQKM